VNISFTSPKSIVHPSTWSSGAFKCSRRVYVCPWTRRLGSASGARFSRSALSSDHSVQIR